MVIPPLSPPLSPVTHGTSHIENSYNNNNNNTNNNNNNNDNGDRDNKKLSNLDTSYNDTNNTLFSSNGLNSTLSSTVTNNNKSFLYTPDTPTVPKFDNSFELLKDLNNNIILEDNNYNNQTEYENTKPTKTYRKTYILKNQDLQTEFLLKKNIFQIELLQLIGKGSSSYVLKSNLFSKFDSNHKLITSIKIPSSVNKATFIEKELEFFKLLKDYYNNHWLNYNNNNYEFPFINLLGVYYINKDMFNLLPRETEVPCLILENLQMDLNDFIINKNKNKINSTDLAIGKENFWKLVKCLITSLNILNEMQCVHCDFKPQNILLNTDSNNDTLISNFKIIDFTSSGLINKLQNPDLTMQYSHPDLILKHKNPSIETDLYSVGLILLFTMIGHSPYDLIDNKSYLLSILMDPNHKILNILTQDDLSILQNEKNSTEFELLRLILSDSCSLSQLNTYLHNLTI